MRYGNPSIENALQKSCDEQKVRRLLVFCTLYPQYCAATTASTFDAVTNVLQKTRWIPELRFINQYFDEKKLILKHWLKIYSTVLEQKWQASKDIVFSYHGIPKKYHTQGDPYHCFCLKTTRLVQGVYAAE